MRWVAKGLRDSPDDPARCLGLDGTGGAAWLALEEEPGFLHLLKEHLLRKLQPAVGEALLPHPAAVWAALDADVADLRGAFLEAMFQKSLAMGGLAPVGGPGKKASALEKVAHEEKRAAQPQLLIMDEFYNLLCAFHPLLLDFPLPMAAALNREAKAARGGDGGGEEEGGSGGNEGGGGRWWCRAPTNLCVLIKRAIELGWPKLRGNANKRTTAALGRTDTVTDAHYRDWFANLALDIARKLVGDGAFDGTLALEREAFVRRFSPPLEGGGTSGGWGARGYGGCGGRGRRWGPCCAGFG